MTFPIPKSMELIEEVEPGVGKVIMVKTGQVQYRYLPGNPQGKKTWALARAPEAAQRQSKAMQTVPGFASEMAANAHEARKRKKGEAIVRMAKERGLAINTPIEVYAEAAAMLTMEIFNDENSLRDRLEAYKKVGGDVGLVENLRDGYESGTPAIAIQINVSPEMTEKYIDAEIIEIDSE